MYKNQLVHIPTELSPRAAIDSSISLAMSCGAHLDAVAIGFESVNNVAFVAERGAAVASIFKLEHERAMERAEAALAIDASPARLTQHLARNGLPVRTISLEADRRAVQPSLLSIAADESLDLLLMGGYGHSRMQETVFGGVPRDMFGSMTTPVLMSH